MIQKLNRFNSVDVKTIETSPAWLNIGVFSDILHKKFNDFKRITKFHYEPKAGGVISDLSVQIGMQMQDGHSKCVTFVLKTNAFLKSSKAVSGETGFEKELKTYLKILPAFEVLYQNASINLRFAPSKIDINLPNRQLNYQLVLLEDAQSKGYRNARQAGEYDLPHMEFALQKLAAFHAASAAFIEEGGDIPKIFTRFSNSYKSWNNQLQQLNECDVLFNRKFYEGLRWYDIREFQDKITDYRNSQQSTELEVKEFNVLLHGSCWYNNILFSYNAFDRIKDVLFVNFRNCQIGSPAVDLLCLLLTAPRLADKLRRFDYFVKFYYDKLVENLTALKYRKHYPKLTDLHLAIINLSWFGIEVISKVLPFVLVAPNATDIDIKDVVMCNGSLNTDLVNEAYSNDRYAKDIYETLPWMENRAFLEK